MSVIGRGMSRRARVAAIGATALALMIGATGTANAAIGTMTAALNINVDGCAPGSHWVYVGGRIEMTDQEALKRLSDGYRVVIRLWGEDPVTSEQIGATIEAREWAANGLKYEYYGCYSSAQLNEDRPGEDDIYAGVRLMNPDNQSVKAKESNRYYHGF